MKHAGLKVADRRVAGIGVAMHSGWGVLVAVAGEAAALEVVERRRIL